MRGKRLTEAQKGKMARRLVYYCIAVLTIAAVWAAVVKTRSPTADLSDVLTFIGAAFGGELLMLLAKRIFTNPGKQTDTTTDC